MSIDKEIIKIQRFITEQVEESRSKGLIIGISGGIDSISFKKSLERTTDIKVKILQPGESVEITPSA